MKKPQNFRVAVTTNDRKSNRRVSLILFFNSVKREETWKRKNVVVVFGFYFKFFCTFFVAYRKSDNGRQIRCLPRLQGIGSS